MTLADAFVSKRNNFTAVRLLAALAVVLSHAFYISTGVTESEPLISSTGLSLGGHAVNLFFGISGCLILASWERHPDPLRFALARTLRIMPALIVAACVMVVSGMWLTQLPLTDYLTSSKLGAFLLKAFSFNARATLPGVFESQVPTNIVLMTIWTLKYEVAAYLGVLVFGLIGLTRSRFFYPVALTVCIAAEVALALWPEIAQKHTSLPHFARFGFCFVLGMSAWRFRAYVRLDGTLFLVAIAALATATLFGGLPRALLYPAEIYAGLWVALSPRLPVVGWLQQTDLSYGIYLYGWPISQALQVQWPGVGMPSLVALSMVLAVGAAALSWIMVERPSVRALPRMTAWAMMRATKPIIVAPSQNPSNG
ncbi:acyltransferase [Agaricicola taiwanensis]|uniref:Acyltransferase n=1 Tax=Agaricicola taiwanensis TaxID=591372 RepID=A0A8J2YI87_9RHOB|nr:acyltransferase [Agaricicola taiwanensis]GGE44763.1 acyltransferase [Agaricicola taiwanensis]